MHKRTHVELVLFLFLVLGQERIIVGHLSRADANSTERDGPHDVQKGPGAGVLDAGEGGVRWNPLKVVLAGETGHHEFFLFNITGEPDGNVLANLRQLWQMCREDQENQAYKQRLSEQIGDENERFFSTIGTGVESRTLDPDQTLAREVYEAMKMLHDSGEGYAALEEADSVDKQSTDLWAAFSRSAAHTFLSYSPHYFLQPAVSPWVHQGMFSSWSYTFAMQLALMLLSGEWNMWRPMLEETPVGTPPVCDIGTSSLVEIRDAPVTSSNLVHQVFHLFMFHLVTGMHVWEAAEVVVEFGGGYGALSAATLAGGFKGQYVIYDLPVFSQVQTYYLRANGYKVLALADYEASFLAGVQGVYTTSDHLLLTRLLNTRLPGGGHAQGGG